VIAWLGSAAASDPALAGGKAAALSRLHGRFHVPRGFVASVEAGDDDIRAAAGELGASLAAVRSSGHDEDGTTTSFAGQHTTLLGVSPVEIVDAVASCRASAAGPEAVAYRRRHGLAPATTLPVLVQELVAADVSAVAFSVDPVRRTGGAIVVNANYGLGESVVSGLATPDTYRVDRDSGAVTAEIGAKERMTVLADGRAADVPVPQTLRRRRALTDEQVTELARLVLAVEAELGQAVDVECAFADDDLWLLQARPVTTLG
jgi:phosphoenolpyruvate synthase/pyruvate phosphate dikinase